MILSSSLTYKIADTLDEMEQIHRLNYETFVEEIPQHARNEERRLVDRFHAENTYIIAKDGSQVVGMAAVRGNRPFSLDQKLGSVDVYLPEGANACEIRLLSVKRDYRGSRTFFALFEWLVSYCLTEGFDTVLISGTDRQVRLYRHMGFQPFGPAIGTESARFQPMKLTKEEFLSSGRMFRQLVNRKERPISGHFLPGPVRVHKAVAEAWAQPAISHRSDSFCQEMAQAQKKLQTLSKTAHAVIAVGTGTLANELVAAQLSRSDDKGLILVNGEFGERLADHADRWNLNFSVLRKSWNTPLTLSEIETAIKKQPEIRWLWTVHCETSTGYLYPIEELKHICRRYDVRLCLDACSSLGVIPADFSGVHLASSGSGKGLGAYPGLALVFHEEPVSTDSRLPAYLDLGLYAKTESVPFTHSSNSLMALNAALDVHSYPDPKLTTEVSRRLKASGLEVLGERGKYSPGILTIALPDFIDSKEFGDGLKKIGIHISYESGYLLQRNWVQLAFMGVQDQEQVMRAVGIVMHQFQQAAEDWKVHR